MMNIQEQNRSSLHYSIAILAMVALVVFPYAALALDTETFQELSLVNQPVCTIANQLTIILPEAEDVEVDVVGSDEIISELPASIEVFEGIEFVADEDMSFVSVASHCDTDVTPEIVLEGLESYALNADVDFVAMLGHEEGILLGVSDIASIILRDVTTLDDVDFKVLNVEGGVIAEKSGPLVFEEGVLEQVLGEDENEDITIEVTMFGGDSKHITFNENFVDNGVTTTVTGNQDDEGSINGAQGFIADSSTLDISSVIIIDDIIGTGPIVIALEREFNIIDGDILDSIHIAGDVSEGSFGDFENITLGYGSGGWHLVGYFQNSIDGEVFDPVYMEIDEIVITSEVAPAVIIEEAPSETADAHSVGN
jgi:hypothetical protein